MNLYLISRKGLADYDQYDSAVVVAESPEDAKTIHPSTAILPRRSVPLTETDLSVFDSWVSQDNIDVMFLGVAHPSLTRGVVCASFNAG